MRLLLVTYHNLRSNLRVVQACGHQRVPSVFIYLQPKFKHEVVDYIFVGAIEFVRKFTFKNLLNVISVGYILFHLFIPI